MRNTSRTMMLAAILAAPLLARGAEADAKESCPRVCTCQKAQPAPVKSGTSAEVPAWVRQIWTTP